MGEGDAVKGYDIKVLLMVYKKKILGKIIIRKKRNWIPACGKNKENKERMIFSFFLIYGFFCCFCCRS